MAQALLSIISECANTMGRAKPVITNVEVIKRPMSIGADPSSRKLRSSEPQCENRAFGNGARTKVSAENGQYSDEN